MPKRSSLALLVATRKGAFIMLGQIAHHMVQDPRDPRVLMLSMRTGHLGPTLYG